MPVKKYHIKLESDERDHLLKLSRSLSAAALKVQRAKALVAMDCSRNAPALSDSKVAKICGLSVRSLQRLRERVCEVGALGALERKPRLAPPVDPKVTGEVEAMMVKIACSEVPADASRWTMQLIADRLIELELLESICSETVRTTLKKNDLKPWQQECWCIAPEKDAAFVAAMEDVLATYERKPDPERPLVCLDEFSKQLLSQIAEPLAAEPATDHSAGKRERYDAEYVREGSASAFILAMPHLGKRELFVGKDARRTSLDYAEVIEFLCDKLFPEAPTIVLVQDNLNTHNEASLYKRFAPEKARRLADKLEVHYTPKHGSWLNMAEIEISLLARSALKPRIASRVEFEEAAKANIARRNQSPRPINWQFTNKDARIKLKRLYPSV